MNNFFQLNPDNFKKWMKSQSDFEVNMDQSLIGLNVETKLSPKRLFSKITLENGKALKVIKEFLEFGGSLKSVDGDEYLIEVKSGSFYVNKKYVIV